MTGPEIQTYIAFLYNNIGDWDTLLHQLRIHALDRKTASTDPIVRAIWSERAEELEAILESRVV